MRVESSSCCFPMELVSFVRPREYGPRQSENVFKLHNHEIWIKIFLMYLNKRITKICKFERTLDSKMGEGFNL